MKYRISLVLFILLSICSISSCGGGGGGGDDSSGPSIPRSGLIGEWLFSGNADDTSGNNLDGTVNGATLTADRDGKAGNAYNFNGSNEINIADNALFSFSGDFSISAWFKTSSSATQSIIRKHNSGTTNGFWIQTSSTYNPDNTYNGLDGYVASVNGETVLSNTSVINNTWHHVVLCYNGTSNITELYIDNVLQTDTGVGHGTYWNSVSLLIGSGFTGDIDDVRIYNRALSAAEISLLYNE